MGAIFTETIRSGIGAVIATKIMTEQEQPLGYVRRYPARILVEDNSFQQVFSFASDMPYGTVLEFAINHFKRTNPYE